MKKLKLLLILFTTTLITMWLYVGANYDFPYEYMTNENEISSGNYETEIWQIMKYDNITQTNSVLNRLLDLFKLSNQSWYDYWWWTSKAVYYAKMIVNLMLSFVSFIALVMVIYAFYMIFFLKDEAGITKAKQVLKWVAIAIIIMWLSRFIVSMIFWIQSNSANPENDIPPVNNTSYINSAQADISNVSNSFIPNN
mgnify:CR=1 FL=1|jgi:hypothetical protein